TLHEVNAASTAIAEEAHEDANIIFGSVVDENSKDEVRITVIATGFDPPSKNRVVTRGGGRGPAKGKAPAASQRTENRDSPTHIRQRWETQPRDRPAPRASSDVPILEPDGSAHLDIPTFLRRQAD